MGYVKETTDGGPGGGSAFPLNVNFNMSEDPETEEGKAWLACPLRSLINTPEGYIWVRTT